MLTAISSGAFRADACRPGGNRLRCFTSTLTGKPPGTENDDLSKLTIKKFEILQMDLAIFDWMILQDIFQGRI